MAIKIGKAHYGLYNTLKSFVKAGELATFDALFYASFIENKNGLNDPQTILNFKASFDNICHPKSKIFADNALNWLWTRSLNLNEKG